MVMGIKYFRKEPFIEGGDPYMSVSHRGNRERLMHTFKGSSRIVQEIYLKLENGCK